MPRRPQQRAQARRQMRVHQELSCKHEMLALEFERLGREVEAGPQIVALQIGKLLQEVLERVASGQILEHGLDRIAQKPNGRFPVANFRINRDA